MDTFAKEPTPATLRIAATFLEGADGDPIAACRAVVAQMSSDGTLTAMVCLAPVVAFLGRLAEGR